MSDWTSSYVSATNAAVHAGPGPQYVVSLPGSEGKTPRSQAADELRWLAQRFVHPRGFGEARVALETHRTVFLAGPPGSGRTAAAKELLRELAAENETIHELLVQEEESKTPLNPDHIADGDLVWLDLSDITVPRWTEIQAELSSLRQAVHEHAARLVVLLPHATEDLRPEFGRYRVRLARPAAREVLSRYLRVEGILGPGGLPPLPFLDEGRPLREISQYAQLVADARKRAFGEGDLTAWCTAAYQALSGRGANVADLVATLSQGTQRALLLAVAMLHGAPVGIVHRASVSLLRLVEHPPEERPVLERATFDSRLRDIKAEMDASGNVWFQALGYDSAVRRYFWTQMPEIHDHMGAWMGQTIDAERLIGTELADLVGRFAEQLLDERYWPTLFSLVEEWTASPTGSRVKAAAVILQCGLRHEKSGRAFRRQIYDWCTRSLPYPLADVVMVACRDEMAVTHPDEALVRLHHLARREHGTRARQALAGLVSDDRRFLRQMLNRLTDPNPERKRWLVDVDLFLEFAIPEALTAHGPAGRSLIDESAVRGRLTNGWSHAFADKPPETWQPRAKQWLRCATVSNERHRHELLDVLIGAGEQRADVLALLYAMTREPELRGSVSDLVLQKINVVQGVDFG